MSTRGQPAQSAQADLSRYSLCPPYRKIGGILFYRCPSVRLSVGLSVRLRPRLWGSSSTFGLYGVQLVQLVVLGCKNCIWGVFLRRLWGSAFLFEYVVSHPTTSIPSERPSVCLHKLNMKT